MSKTIFTLAATVSLGISATALAAADRPNILLIVADDLGYTDLSVTGSEIATPNIDALANAGKFHSDFIVAPNCSPTRSMLLSGTDNHLAGLGLMAEMPKAPNQKGQPGYLGHLNDNVVPFTTTLQNAGYRTYMAGKWHLGGKDGHRPESNGFDESFALMQGGGSHYSDMGGISPGYPHVTYFNNGQRVESLPEDFYSSDFYADRMISYIGDGSEEPFFGYLAFTAPHWPLQAPAEWIAPHEGKYDQGYELLKASRSQGLKDAGLFPTDAPVNDFRAFGGQKPWDTLTAEEKKISSRSMEIYAGMVSNLDWNVGRVVDHLKATGQYDNTMIMVMSDNGAEGGNIRFLWNRYSDEKKAAFFGDMDMSLENMGKPKSFVFYDAWGQAGVGPYRAFKGVGTLGGVRTFMIAKPAGEAVEASVSDTLVSVMDLAPTFLEMAGATHPTTVDGRDILPHKGMSILDIIHGKADSVRDETAIMGTELLHNFGLRKGDWRMVKTGRGGFKSDGWMLFDLANDPAETNDISAENPEKLAELQAAWKTYLADSNVIFPQKTN